MLSPDKTINNISDFLEIRSRNQALITYSDLTDIELTICKHYKQIIHYAFIYHDKDTFESGELKEPHWHICLNLREDLELRKVIAWFKEVSDQNTMAEILLDKTRAFEYLTHKNHPDKYHYSDDEVITDSKAFWYNKEQRAMELLNDILHGADELYLCNKYGREYIVNGAKYRSKAYSLRKEVKNPYIEDNKIVDMPSDEYTAQAIVNQIEDIKTL